MAIGTITPNFVRDSVAGSLGRNRLGGLMPIKHFKGTRRITTLITFLISSSTTCVAKRSVSVGKKLCAWGR